MLGRVLKGLVPWARPARAKVVTMKYGLPEEKPPVATIEVVMLRDARGCPDGFTSTAYAAGRRYHLPESLARSFFSMGAADPAEAYEDKREAMNLETGRAVVLKGLDSESARTHSEAATAATEDDGDAAGSAREAHSEIQADRSDRRPRRPRRVQG